MMGRHIPWESADSGEGLILQSQIADFLKQNGHNAKKQEDHKAICAEINVLSRLGVDSIDRITLLASDNAQGRVCAEMLKKTIIDAFDVVEPAVEIRRIEGLQVLDAKKLREHGLKNLVKTLLDYLANDEIRYSYDIILNPTGGFKGVVPFIAIMGMLYGRRSVYLFEFAEELINLPPLPFSFDMQLYNRVRPALDFVDEQVAVTEDAFLGKIVNYVPEERDLFMSFTEPFDNQTITLSPLAYCLLKMGKTGDAPIIAESALEVLSRVKGESALVIKRLIKNSVNPLWRQQHYHSCNTSDLLVLKQGHTSERVAGFIYNNQFQITNVFSNHDEYSANIHKCKRGNFAQATFVPYIIDENVGVDEDNPDAIIAERDKLLLDKSALSEQVQQLQQQNEIVLQEAMKSKKLIDDMNQILDEKSKYLKEIEAENENLKNKQNINDKSFFARLRYLFGGAE
jgi:putative CRISPR-associated protein (TIGR02619 family)